jgi:hypothetical protein
MSKAKPKKTLPDLPVPDSKEIKGGGFLDLIAAQQGKSQDPTEGQDLGSSTPPPPPKRPT